VDEYLPEFDEIHVISDLHLGGRNEGGVDFQIFTQGERLAGFIKLVQERHPDRPVALVLNGDVIDGLAEQPPGRYMALDAADALALLHRIMDDPSFAMVWKALGEFVRAPGRHLVIVLGNHDLELALPVVQAELRQRLAGKDAAARQRIVFSTHGAGFGCKVGKARVFCTHGNEVDAMNWVDYNQLGQLANAIAAGRSARSERWKPNGGTRLVVDVMNIVKQRYPFVDLFEPPTAAVAAVLLALDRDTFRRIDLGDAIPILRDRKRGASITHELLSAHVATRSDGATPAGAPPIDLLGPTLRAYLQDGGDVRSRSEDDLLVAAEAAMRDPAASVSTDAGTLGWGDVVAGLAGFKDPVEALRCALLDWSRAASTHEISSPDGLFEDMRARVGPGIHFTVTGHTHLARALEMPGGQYYFNCGTWIRLLHVPAFALEDKVVFREYVWPRLKDGSTADFDKAELPRPNGEPVRMLLDRTTAVRISSDGHGTTGELLQVTGERSGDIAVARLAGDAFRVGGKAS